jgi:hypothetical protein
LINSRTERRPKASSPSSKYYDLKGQIFDDEATAFERGAGNDFRFNWHSDHRFSRELLDLEYYGVDVEASLAYFRHHGGFCDCEVLFNVEASCRKD